MELNDLEKIRVEKLNALRQQGIEPYPTRNSVNHQIIDVENSFTAFEKINQNRISQRLSPLAVESGQKEQWGN